MKTTTLDGFFIIGAVGLSVLCMVLRRLLVKSPDAPRGTHGRLYERGMGELPYRS